MAHRPSNHDAQRERFVEDLLDIMSVSEKAGQLVLLPLTEGADANEIEDLRERIRQGQLGGLSSAQDPARIAELQQLASEQSRLGIPLFVIDAPSRGETVVMPWPFALACSWAPASVERCMVALAEEAVANGKNWLLAPDVALCNSTSDSDIASSWGSSGRLARSLASAAVRGLRSTTGDRASLLTCLRTDDPSWTRRRDKARWPEKLDLIAGVLNESQPDSVSLGPLTRSTPDIGGVAMSADISIGGPGGFKGIDFVDWAEIARAAGQHLPRVPYAGFSVDAVVDAVNDGRISQHWLDDAVRKIVGAKYDLGLFRAAARPYRRRHRDMARAARATALDAARDAIVLLRNSPALLPLSVFSGRILVIGQAAKDRSLPTGESGHDGASLVDGLDALGLDYLYVPGLALRQDDGSSIPGALIDADRMAIGMANEAARRSQTTIIALGEGASLSEAERTLIETVKAANRDIVLVTLGSHPLDPEISGSKLPCVVHAGQLGTMSGHAIAEVLTGECAPRGRLAAPMGEQVRDGLGLGHGLGYSECSLTDTTVELDTSRISVTAMLQNLGPREVTETVQTYIRRPDRADRGARELAGFQRVSLTAGESLRLQLVVDADQLGRFGTDGEFTVEPGTYEIAIGLSEARAHGAQIEISPDLADAMAKHRSDDAHPALFAQLKGFG